MRVRVLHAAFRLQGDRTRAEGLALAIVAEPLGISVGWLREQLVKLPASFGQMSRLLRYPPRDLTIKEVEQLVQGLVNTRKARLDPKHGLEWLGEVPEEFREIHWG